MNALELADSISRMDTFTGYQRNMLKDAAAELRRLAAVEASILQAILDPENQPSQYGTVTLEKHADKVSELTDKYCALVDRLSTLKAERDALKEQMRDVAMLLLDNDRSGIKAWAAGLVLGESSGKWSVRTVVADQQKEIDALKAENERLTNCLKKANHQAEDFERRWYLADMELERIKALPPVAWCLGNPELSDSSNLFLAHEFAPDGEHEDEWTALYALGSKTHD